MKTAFLFSGQGSQIPGMGIELFDRYDVVKRVFATASETLGRDIAALCFDGTQEDLNLTHNTQVCMLAVDIAAGLALREEDIEADCVAGFSLGEYAALVYAGAMKLEDAFRVVQLRADAMQAAVPVGQGTMAALMGADGEKAEAVCAQVKSGYVVAANYNSPVQTVISGSAGAVDEAIVIAADMGLRAIRLAVSAPFHCALMEPAAQRIGETLAGIELSMPRLPVYCNVTGQPLQPGEDITDMLVRQAMSPVRWVDTLNNMQAAGVANFVECGVGKTLWGLTRKTLKSVNALKVVDLKSMNDTLAKLAEA